MPIHKREDGKYLVDLSIGFNPITGKRKRKRRVVETKKEADKLYRDMQDEFAHDHHSLNQNLNFTQVKNLYLEESEIIRKPNYHQIQSYKIDKHIYPYFKNSNLKKVTLNHIREFQKHLIDSNLNNKTINNIMIILNKIFDKAIEQNIIKVNPCISVKNLPLEKKEMKFWTPDQFKSFTELINDDEFLFKTFYTLAYLTGMRTGEMLALNWNDISNFKKEINVQKSLTFINNETIIHQPKTKNALRQISINKKLLDLLNEWKEKQRDLFAKLRMHYTDDIFIFQYREKPPSKDIFSRRVKTICQRGDIEPIRLHDLRHSHVALLIHQGEDYAMIKERLGHASIKTTIDVYGHLFPNKQRETADRLDDLF